MLGVVLTVLCVWILHGASGVETEVLVMEGDSVSLHTGVKTDQQHTITWYYNNIRIAEITGDQSQICTDVQCNEGTERFRDRLELDHQTGSLTVRNIRTTDSGDYTLQIIIISSSDSEKIFSVTVQGVSAADVKSVKEGESVTLDPGVINNTNDLMTWFYNKTHIAKITGDQNQIYTDERFRDRLEVNQTGSLTIRNTRTTDSGDYHLHITSSSFSVRRMRSFSVSVTGSGWSSAVPGSGWSSAAVAGVSAAVVILLVAAAAAVIYKHRESITAKHNNETDPVKYSSVSQTEAAANGASQKKTDTETPAVDHGGEIRMKAGLQKLFLRRMVLVGRTGAGKSSSGNTILGERVFKAAKSPSSVTKECRKESGEVSGREITVVDTPGLFDTDVSDDNLKQEISKCVNMTAPGPHAIILVIQLGPLTKEERLSVEKIRAIFGEEADKHTIVLFTHGDELDSTIEDSVSKAGEDLKEILSRCGGRYHVFNNKDMEDRIQVSELLKKVEDMVTANGDRFYTSDLYQNVELMLKTKEEELKKLYEKTIQEKEMELESRFSEEKKKLEETIETLTASEQEKEEKIKELERLNQRNTCKISENKCYYEAKLREARLEAERTYINDIQLIKILTKLQSLQM